MMGDVVTDLVEHMVSSIVHATTILNVEWEAQGSICNCSAKVQDAATSYS